MRESKRKMEMAARWKGKKWEEKGESEKANDRRKIWWGEKLEENTTNSKGKEKKETREKKSKE